MLHTHIAESSPKETIGVQGRVMRWIHTRLKQKENKSQAQSSSIAVLALDWVGISGGLVEGKICPKTRPLCWVERVSLRHVLIPSRLKL